LTGLDEHGSKIAKAAKKQVKKPRILLMNTGLKI